MMSHNKANTRSKSSKSVSDEGCDPEVKQILQKLDEMKKTSDAQYQNLLQAVNKVNQRLDSLETEQNQVIESLDFVSKDVEDLKKQYQELRSVVSKLESINSNRSDEERKVINSVDRIEQEKNLKALLIANVPSSQHEDTTKIVTNLAAKLEASIMPGDIESAFRLKSDTAAHAGKPPLIMVKFTNTTSRDNLYNSRKNFKKLSITTKSIGFRSADKIFINEALTRSQRTLFHKARQTQKSLSWKYSWTYHGQVYLRKSTDDDPIKVTSVQILDELAATTQQHNG